MTRPAVKKKRPGKKLDEAALMRRLAGALPLASAAGTARVTAWLAEIKAGAAGKAIALLNAAHPALAGLLASVAETAPFLWDLIRADPAGFVNLITSDPDAALAALLANAQRGAVFVTLHISSTGLPGTVRVYTLPDSAATVATGGILNWDRAQAPYISLSRKFADAVQGELAQRFKGSPNNSQSAAIRQLRTTAAPAVAVEISSVSVQDRTDLDRMMPGVADAIARGLASFRPSYVLPGEAGGQP